jgi:uncharacterized membrane protein (UPF0182 family)
VTYDAPTGGEGRGGRAVVAEPPGRSRALLWTLLVLGVIVLLVVLASGFYTDLLWYQSVDATSVFTTTLWTRLGLLMVFGGLMALIVGVNMWIAYRVRPVFRVMSPEQHSLERYRMALDPLRKLAVFGIPLLLGLLAGVSATAEWKDWLLFRNSTPFGTGDAIFGMDISFYVFTLPFLSFVLGFLFAAVVLAFLAAGVVHYIYGGIRLLPPDDRMSNAARAHLGILIGIFMLLKAAAYWLDRYAVTLSTDDKVDGVTYKDINALIPGQTILVWVSLICAVLFFISAFRKGFTLAITSLVLFIATSLIVGSAYPAFVQSFQVLPTEQVRESAYIQNNINATRMAYGLQNATVNQYQAIDSPSPSQVKASAGTVENVRLLDPSIVSPTFKQIQGIRTQYRFPDSLDIDRYTIDGKQRGAVIAVREVSTDNLDTSNQNWANVHTVYTHGYGVVAAYDNTSTVDGQPSFFEQDMPPSGKLLIDQPRVYFGEYSPEYSIVGGPAGSPQREVDYPTDAGQATYTYTGTGGVPLGPWVNRLLYAVKYQDPNIILSNLVNTDSRILDVREPRDRVQKVAPWLQIDGDPYPIVVDGKVLWMVDGYTTTNEYPNAQHTSFGDATTDSTTATTKNVQAQARDQINYIRNSVKATVDAYTGQVNLYEWEPNDPILKTWEKAFPGTVQPRTAIPAAVLEHVRYPEDIFKVQRTMFAQYHVTDPSGFYSGQDFWTVPNDPTKPATSAAQPPYYLQVQGPSDEAPVFSLTTTFAPIKRTNLAAFMSVSSAPDNGYGQIKVLQLPSDTTIPGPSQVQNKFESDPVTSAQLSLLRRNGSNVDLGNLLSLPVAGGILYVEPVYISATGETGYPLLQKVLVGFGNKVSFSNTLAQGIADVFGTSTSTNPGGNNTGPSVTPTPTPSGSTGTAQQRLAVALAEAQAAYDAGRAALAKGDFTAYGEAQKRLEAALAAAAAAQKELGGPVVTPSTSPGASASPTPSPSVTIASS